MKRISNLILSVTVAMAVLICAGAVAMMMACSHLGGSVAYADEIVSDDNEEPSAGDEYKAEEADSGDGKSDQRIIACWGDSLTEGVGANFALIAKDGTFFNASFKSYPEILEKLTGITTVNYGVSGATSDEIVFLQEALLRLRELDIARTAPKAESRHEGDVLVLELGSNGGWGEDYDTLIQQYRDMIERSGCDNYIIVGDTDDPGTSIADMGQKPLVADQGADETEWEAALSEAFGDHFINTRAFLVERGLDVAGLKADDKDDEAASQGCVSEKLRSDWTHLNSFGYYAQAVAVYEKGQELGYW